MILGTDHKLIVDFQGCGVIANESNYGEALNQRGGGIYATGKYLTTPHYYSPSKCVATNNKTT